MSTCYCSKWRNIVVLGNSLWCSSFAKKSKDSITSSSEGGGIFRGHLALCFFMNFGAFWRWRFHSCYIDSSSNPKEFYFYHFFIFYQFFWKNRGLNFMKWLINKAFLRPSVEQILSHQIDNWTSKTITKIYINNSCFRNLDKSVNKINQDPMQHASPFEEHDLPS